MRSLIESWNRRDAEAFAALFTPSARYVTGQGERVRGRLEIARLVREAEPGPEVTVKGTPAADGDEDSGTVRFAWTAVAAGVARQGRITCAVALKGGRWLIETLENDEEK